MSIVMKPDASKKQVHGVVRLIKSNGLRADVSSGRFQVVIGIVGDENKIDFGQVKSMPGVYDVNRIQAPYRLMSPHVHPQ